MVDKETGIFIWAYTSVWLVQQNQRQTYMSTQCHIEETEKSYQGHIFVLSPTLVSFIEFLNYFDYLRGHFIKRTDGILPMYVKVSLLMFLGKNKSYNTFFKIYLFQVFAFQHSFLLYFLSFMFTFPTVKSLLYVFSY